MLVAEGTVGEAGPAFRDPYAGRVPGMVVDRSDLWDAGDLLV